MGRTKFYYNTESCTYEKIKKSKSDIIFNFLGFFLSSFILAIVFFLTYTNIYDSPKEILLKNENKALKNYYEMLQQDMRKIKESLGNLQDMDAYVYRTVLGAKPLPKSILSAGAGGVDRYENLKNKDQKNLIVKAYKKADEIRYLLKIQSQSYDEILTKSKKRSHMLAHIPCMQPIYNKDLKRLSSSFGMRMHPVYKLRTMHYGQDFAVPVGTAIYAPADGIIKRIYNSKIGGKLIVINHGYGIKTRYLHLHKICVKINQKVRRGQKIGESGASGSACAGPHLHYEVLKNGKHVNPIHYFFKELSPSQFREVQRLASRDIESMD